MFVFLLTFWFLPASYVNATWLYYHCCSCYAQFTWNFPTVSDWMEQTVLAARVWDFSHGGIEAMSQIPSKFLSCTDYVKLTEGIIQLEKKTERLKDIVVSLLILSQLLYKIMNSHRLMAMLTLLGSYILPLMNMHQTTYSWSNYHDKMSESQQDLWHLQKLLLLFSIIQTAGTVVPRLSRSKK